MVFQIEWIWPLIQIVITLSCQHKSSRERMYFRLGKLMYTQSIAKLVSYESNRPIVKFFINSIRMSPIKTMIITCC
jgi:hypothetical protein